MSNQWKRIDTGPPAEDSGERATLVAFLTYLREAVLAKVADVPDEAASRPAVPSGTSLLGLVKHMAMGERFWLAGQFLGEDIGKVDFRMDVEPGDTVAAACAAYRAAIVRADEIIAAAPSLEQLSAGNLHHGGTKTLRWILLHLIEETARHAGHADILREQLDGSIGR